MQTGSDQTPPPIDQDALDLPDLARAILDRRLRPRAASIRRLAEAVLVKGKKKRKKANKTAKKKIRKLATIPGQNAP
jgi:hypothetical protein